MADAIETRRKSTILRGSGPSVPCPQFQRPDRIENWIMAKKRMAVPRYFLCS